MQMAAVRYKYCRLQYRTVTDSSNGLFSLPILVIVISRVLSHLRLAGFYPCLGSRLSAGAGVATRTCLQQRFRFDSRFHSDFIIWPHIIAYLRSKGAFAKPEVVRYFKTKRFFYATYQMRTLSPSNQEPGPSTLIKLGPEHKLKANKNKNFQQTYFYVNESYPLNHQ